MHTALRAPFTLLPLLLLAGCGKSPEAPYSADPLVGCFATSARKAPEFRIEQSGGQYRVAFSREQAWETDPSPLQKATRAEIKQAFGSGADQIQTALVRPGGGFGIFHFAPGATLKGKHRNSDYMALVLIGAGPVFKMDCGS